MIIDKAVHVLEELFQLLLFRYQIGLETSIKVVILTLIVCIFCVTNFINVNRGE